jgi:CRISPR/Cas system-associated exonuclease Cas4 (RecB family)
MAKIHIKDPLNFAIESKLVLQEGRGYLGVSQLGHECPRYIWYVYNNAPKEPVTPRMTRIWERGNWEEERIIRDLKSIGILVLDQQKEVTVGYAKGHIDGLIEFIPKVSTKPHLFEAKTMADNYWKQCVKNGVKNSNFSYYVQFNIYAYLLHLPRILFVTVNKNNEERHFERLHADYDAAVNYIIRGAEIVEREVPPNKIGGPEWYLCKMCSYKGVCHG